jgi:hypothetical protein
MLEHLDASLEALLRASVPLSAQDVDVTFETPTKDWSARLTRPTVNLFLWDLKRSAERSRSGMETIERNGQRMQRAVLPRIELRYLITAWTQDHRDERALLSGLLRSVLRTYQLPVTFMSPELVAIGEPVNLLLARSGETPIDVFKLIDNTMKAALDVVVHTAVDIDLARPLATPVTEIGVHIGDMTTPGRQVDLRRVAGEVRIADAIGAHVFSPRGHALVNEASRFLIHASEGDEIVVELDPPLSVVVPAVGGVVVG